MGDGKRRHKEFAQGIISFILNLCFIIFILLVSIYQTALVSFRK